MLRNKYHEQASPSQWRGVQLACKFRNRSLGLIGKCPSNNGDTPKNHAFVKHCLLADVVAPTSSINRLAVENSLTASMYAKRREGRGGG